MKYELEATLLLYDIDEAEQVVLYIVEVTEDVVLSYDVQHIEVEVEVDDAQIIVTKLVAEHLVDELDIADELDSLYILDNDIADEKNDVVQLLVCRNDDEVEVSVELVLDDVLMYHHILRCIALTLVYDENELRQIQLDAKSHLLDEVEVQETTIVVAQCDGDAADDELGFV